MQISCKKYLCDPVVLPADPGDPVLEEPDPLKQGRLEGLRLSGHQLVLAQRVVRVQPEVGERDRVVAPLLNQALEHLQ